MENGMIPFKSNRGLQISVLRGGIPNTHAPLPLFKFPFPLFRSTLCSFFIFLSKLKLFERISISCIFSSPTKMIPPIYKLKCWFIYKLSCHSENKQILMRRKYFTNSLLQKKNYWDHCWYLLQKYIRDALKQYQIWNIIPLSFPLVKAPLNLFFS